MGLGIYRHHMSRSNQSRWYSSREHCLANGQSVAVHLGSVRRCSSVVVLAAGFAVWVADRVAEWVAEWVADRVAAWVADSIAAVVAVLLVALLGGTAAPAALDLLPARAALDRLAVPADSRTVDSSKSAAGAAGAHPVRKPNCNPS